MSTSERTAPADCDDTAERTDHAFSVLVDRACALLGRHAKQELVQEVRKIQAKPIPSRTVVVIGEVKRGKSSLINSLLGKPGLSPIGVDITTSAYIRFVPPGDGGQRSSGIGDGGQRSSGIGDGGQRSSGIEDELAMGDVRLQYPGGALRPIPVDELADWVTVDGSKLQDPDLTELPVGAVVAVDSMHLPGVIIVDTPGVNGLDPSHVESAIAATEGASVLLMVCDATAPISAPELDFLKEVSSGIGAVVLAVTKIDQAMQEWRTIVEENRRLLTENAPRFSHVDIIGVSNLIAERAIAVGDPQRSKTAWKTSGVTALADRLLDVLSDADRIARVNTLTSALVAVESVVAGLEAERQTVVDAPGVQRDMTRERKRLEELRQRKREWAARLARDLNKVLLESGGSLRVEVDQLTTAWNKKIDKMRFYQVSRAPQELIAQMTVDIEALAARVSQDYRNSIDKIASELLEEAQIRSQVLEGAFENLDSFKMREQEKFSQFKGFFDPYLLNLVFAGGPISLLIPGSILVVGPAWGAFIIGFRATKAGKEGLRKWLKKAFLDVREDLSHAMRTVQNEVSTELKLVYAELLEKSLMEADKRIKAAEAQAKKSAAERTARLSELIEQIGQARQLKDELLQAIT